jgi:hypothetical protein
MTRDGQQMSFGLLNILMLAGLAGLVIPPLIHLLNRRRFDVVDWGAMQFLEMSQRTRRKVFIEELILMLLRMGLIGLMVLALAAPYIASPLFERMGSRENRDVVLVIDGSTSMSYNATGKSTHDAAKEWAQALVKQLTPGDGVAVLHAKQQVIPVLGELSTDHDKARDALGRLSRPLGGCDWPQAVQAAHQLLQASRRPRRDLIVLTDGQKFGWADDYTLQRWQVLAGQLEGGPTDRPRIWVVNLDPRRPAAVPNWSLAPVRSGRAVASTSIHLETALRPQGQKYQPPHRIRLEIDGQALPDLAAPSADDLKDGQAPLRFTHTFAGSGSHLVTITVEPDAPGRRVKDYVPGDNRQEFAVMIPSLPVLLIDNGPPPEGGKYRGASFLRAALAPKGDRTSAVRARVERLDQLVMALGQDVGPERDTKPKVLILCDVPQLSREHQDAVSRFANDGGGLLVTLGPHVERQHYNEALYRRGDGWFPTWLEAPTGNEFEPAPEEGKADPAAHPMPSSFAHVALELFRGEASSGLGKARFPRWWKVTTPGQGAAAATVARLTSLDPFLVERSFGKGRVILSVVPLDDSWGTNLHRGLEVQEFPLLAHELVYYLAGTRAVSYNLVPGQPIIYQPQGSDKPGTVHVQPPFGDAKEVEAKEWPLIYDDTREPGAYQLTTPGGRTVYYVVQPDPRETEDLTSCGEEDREKVAAIIPLKYAEDQEEILAVPAQARAVWWWLMLGVIVFLCAEVWMTRRIVKGR